jgi:hypothetical protein
LWKYLTDIVSNVANSSIKIREEQTGYIAMSVAKTVFIIR